MEITGYRIERHIADGGMASVHLAVQESLGRHVALKLLNKFERAQDSARFLNEGRTLAGLDHPNIITIYDVGFSGERPFIAMEYLAGGSLEERIAQGMAPEAAVDITLTIGACLDFVHRKGLIHRDVKPANILFHSNGTPKLTDFGIAKRLEVDSNLTLDGSALGSPYYLSPEQAQNKPLDGRADIYSLGIIFYEMLTGRKPFRADSHIETIIAQLTRELPPLPTELALYQEALELMTAKAPDDRFASAAEMVGYFRALRRFAGLVPPNKPKVAVPSAVEADTGDRSRWRRQKSLSAVAAAAILGLLILFAFDWGGRPDQEKSLVDSTPEPPTEAAPAIHADSVRAQQTDPSAAGSAVPLESETVLDTRPVAPEAGTVGAEEVGGIDPAFPAIEPEPRQQPENFAMAPEFPGKPIPPGLPVPLKENEPPRAAVIEMEDSQAPMEPQPSVGQGQEPAIGSGKQQPAAEFIAEAPKDVAPPGVSPSDEGTGEPEIENLLLQAEQALEDNRLTIPSQHSAAYYFAQVLALDPGSREAKLGMNRIAERYLELSRSYMNRHQFDKADRYLRRGLHLQPDSPALQQLQQELAVVDRSSAVSAPKDRQPESDPEFESGVDPSMFHH